MIKYDNLTPYPNANDKETSKEFQKVAKIIDDHIKEYYEEAYDKIESIGFHFWKGAVISEIAIRPYEGHRFDDEYRLLEAKINKSLPKGKFPPLKGIHIIPVF